MDIQQQLRQSQISDINAMVLGEDVKELTVSLRVLCSMMEASEDQEIVQLCREKVQEGVLKLIEQGQAAETEQFKVFL